MVDTEQYQLKLYTTPGGEKLIKRRSGAIEKQYRLNVGRLPVAYRWVSRGSNADAQREKQRSLCRTNITHPCAFQDWTTRCEPMLDHLAVQPHCLQPELA